MVISMIITSNTSDVNDRDDVTFNVEYKLFLHIIYLTLDRKSFLSVA